MAEVDYKEKYENALKMAREILISYERREEMNEILSYVKDDLSDIFPEIEKRDDERIKNEIISYIKENIPLHTHWIDWLERQGYVEWSEESENRYQNLCEIINDSDKWNEASKKGFICWLTSLKKDKSRWKPTEEQLSALDSVTEHCALNGVGCIELLESLSYDLKRL